MKDKYELVSIDLADFKVLSIGDKETGKVICQFNHENEDTKELANKIVNFLNNKNATK
jgi:hypothetical protein